jgi:hypothetical protein
MASARRPISITLDAATADRRVVTDTSLAVPDANQQIEMYYGTQSVFQATILNGAYNIPFYPDTCTWMFGIDDVPFSTTSDYVLTLDADFNITSPEKDWAGLDEANGKISWRVNMATSNLLTALRLKTANRNLMHANLWMLTSIGNLVWSWPVWVNKVFVDPTTAVAVEGVTHITTDVFSSALSEIKTPTSGLYRLKNGALQLKNADQPATPWHTLSISGAAGSEALNIGPGEA